MHSKYKIITIVLSLLLVLSIGTSIVNYKISLDITQKQIIAQSLPLSVDNIYTEIQKQIIQPYLISSMMANDTFVINWVQNEEKSTFRIQQYLESIKNRYGMLAAFLVSDKTHNYYTENGLIETVQEDRESNKWYYSFKNSQQKTEINIDFNENILNEPIMFINFKMFDKDYHYLGSTGVALKVSYIQNMFVTFREKYQLNVSFLDPDGNFILLQHSDKLHKNIGDLKGLRSFKEQLLSRESQIVEYQKNGFTYIINTKYIKELNAHILVEAKLEDFTQETRSAFYLNISISLLLAFIIAFILLNFIKRYNKKLEHISHFDELTDIPNRRNFQVKFEYLSHLKNRSNKQVFLLYIDIDNFKLINDKFGHLIGDKVLKEFANILQKNVREPNLYARWGGEEFIVAFTNITLEKAIFLAEKLRQNVEESTNLQDMLNQPTTISLGLTLVKDNDILDSVISRADEAMYQAKTSGKNRVCTL